MIYILTFLVSSAFVWIGTRECTKRKMEDGMWKTVRLKKIPVLIGLLLPALLASMRAVSVGSDVSFYVVPLFNKAINSNSFSDYVAILGGDINDVGYCLLNYILSRCNYVIFVLGLGTFVYLNRKLISAIMKKLLK